MEERNFKIVIEYDGTDFQGWQIQNNSRTIQGEIQKALRKIFGCDIVLYSAGRTDAGVHATGQVANFKCHTNLSCEKILRALNANISKDITIRSVEEVPLDFHSQFCARHKTYCYRILNSPIRRSISRFYFWQVRDKLDVEKMREASKVLIGKHDFKAFGSKISDEKNCFRTIIDIDIRKNDEFIEIFVKGDGFIYNMVRRIVGTLVEVGRGRFTKSYVAKILASKDRRLSGRTAPACGLTLIEVVY